MATALLLQSPIAIVMLWGPEGVMLYNDAYSRFGGGRHPGLLGRNVREAWPEVADFNDHVLKVVLHGGQPLSYKDRELWLNRDGVSKQLFTDLDYSPVVDESGQPVGVFAVVNVTTERVLADRRIAGERKRQQQLFGHARLCWRAGRARPRIRICQRRLCGDLSPNRFRRQNRSAGVSGTGRTRFFRAS
jgi:PAS domain S-box-containing protein